jgi:hypothetical protein
VGLYPIYPNTYLDKLKSRTDINLTDLDSARPYTIGVGRANLVRLTEHPGDVVVDVDSELLERPTTRPEAPPVKTGPSSYGAVEGEAEGRVGSD